MVSNKKRDFGFGRKVGTLKWALRRPAANCDCKWALNTSLALSLSVYSLERIVSCFNLASANCDNSQGCHTKLLKRPYLCCCCCRRRRHYHFIQRIKCKVDSGDQNHADKWEHDRVKKWSHFCMRFWCVFLESCCCRAICKYVRSLLHILLAQKWRHFQINLHSYCALCRPCFRGLTKISKLLWNMTNVFE